MESASSRRSRRMDFIVTTSREKNCGGGPTWAKVLSLIRPAIQDDVRRLAGVSLLLKPIKPARLRALIASVRE